MGPHRALAEAALFALVLLLAAVGLPVDSVIPKSWLATFNRFAARRYAPLLAVALFAVLFRLALLPWYPIPLPKIHDEFSLLLGAKTFAMGRMVNPTHPLWIYFETFHVLQQPTYVSIYPPAQAAMLALGILLGNAWFAVLICAALVYAAFVWMLRPWFSPAWALAGGILLFSRTSLTYWSDTYWGGTLAALASAVIVGSASRAWFRREARLLDGFLIGAGIAILFNRRPLEGSLLTIGIVLMLAYWLFKKAAQPRLSQAVRLVVPALAVLLPCAAVVARYNMRATGNPLLMPYVKGLQTYAMTGYDILTPPIPEHSYRNPEFRTFYHNEYNYYRYRQQHFLLSLPERLSESWQIYVGPAFTLPLLLAFPFVCRSRRIRPVVLILAGCLAINCTETWIFAHYLAPIAPLLWIVLLESLILLDGQWPKWGRAIVTASMVSCLLTTPGFALASVVRNIRHDTSWSRFKVADTLTALPGRHLVIVRYLPGHHVGEEWVYNEPDIDSSRIVWARGRGPNQDAPLVAYFRGRRIWEVGVGQRVEFFREITDSVSRATAASKDSDESEPRSGMKPKSVPSPR